MGGFYSWKQQDICAPYYDKFYEALPTIYEKSPFKYVQSYFNGLLPRKHISNDHIVKLLELKQATPDVNQNFTN